MTKEQIEEIAPDALFCDGFEDAIIGTVRQFNRTLVCYDTEKCIQILIKRDGMDREDAEEFFEFNVLLSYMGENTPVFFEPIEVPS